MKYDECVRDGLLLIPVHLQQPSLLLFFQTSIGSAKIIAKFRLKTQDSKCS